MFRFPKYCGLPCPSYCSLSSGTVYCSSSVEVQYSFSINGTLVCASHPVSGCCFMQLSVFRPAEMADIYI